MKIESIRANGELSRLARLSRHRTVATSLADALFAAIAIAIAVSQALILRSTARGMQHVAAPRHVAREWAYAIAPAIALVVLLAFAWLAMHPATLQVDGVAPGVSSRG